MYTPPGYTPPKPRSHHTDA